MANTTKQNKKSTTAIIGFIVIALVVTGFVSIMRYSADALRSLSGNDKKAAQYEEFLAPVIMNDPDTFDDVVHADQKQLISIAIWALLEDDLAPDDYDYVDEGMLIPKSHIEDKFTTLFGTDVVPTHMSVDGGEGVEFIFDETREAYIIPITGITAIYAPDVVEIDKKGTTIILTVGCLANTDWTTDNKGNPVAPTPAKYLRISLRENNDGSFYISAIQSASASDYVTDTTTTTSSSTESTSAEPVG